MFEQEEKALKRAVDESSFFLYVETQSRMVASVFPTKELPENVLGPLLFLTCGNPVFQLGEIRIIASVEKKPDDLWWYHVSLSRQDSIPTHEDLIKVRNAFFRKESVVIQVFPPTEEYVNLNPNVLHLWEKLEGKRLIPDLRIDTSKGENMGLQI